MEISLEWCATGICTTAYFIFGIHKINDLDDGVTGGILKFADDIKLFRKTKKIGDNQHFQDDIDKLVRWSENGRCYSILGNVNVYTQGMETLA